MPNEAQITLYKAAETSDYVRYDEQPYPTPPNTPAVGNVRLSKELLDQIGLAERPDAVTIAIVAA